MSKGMFRGVLLNDSARIATNGVEVRPEDVVKQEPTEHSCRLTEPTGYSSYRRVACDQEHDGKCIDVIYGIKTRPRRRSEVQALRYPPGTWTEDAAREHCAGRDGSFTAGKKSKED